MNLAALEQPGLGGPPWGQPGEWAEVNRGLAQAVAAHRSALGLARAYADQIQENLALLFPVWEELCAATCPACPDPCCGAARVWFDLADLLFLHLAGLPLPPTQTRAGLAEPCRYLGPAGCGLDRLTRPWVCAWYLCQPQVNLLARKPPRLQRRLSQAVVAVQSGRAGIMREMEIFLRKAPSI